MKRFLKGNLWMAVTVSALGYFVDVYDIILFTAVRVASLKALSLEGDQITAVGIQLLNIQLVGMLIGGLVWGILGDKRGRLSILFGSIFLYSCANLANAFVSDITTYAVLRFVAGFGLAGELGAGVTLVSELMTKERRGYGTMIIASSGVLGGIAGGFVGDFFSWRTAYIVGGVMGFALLLLRVGVSESGLFSQIKNQPIDKGNILQFVRSFSLFARYVRCLFVGLPVWVFIGIFITLAPEIGRAMDITGPVSAGKAILFFNIGLGLGDLSSSLLSQILRSRKKAATIYLMLTACFTLAYLSLHGVSALFFYGMCTVLGFGSGYWAVFIMIASEQFGTNLRATVTTSVPNLVRGMIVPFSLALAPLRGYLGLRGSLALIGFSCITLAFLSLRSLRETFGTDLDFVEP